MIKCAVKKITKVFSIIWALPCRVLDLRKSVILDKLGVKDFSD